MQQHSVLRDEEDPSANIPKSNDGCPRWLGESCSIPFGDLNHDVTTQMHPNLEDRTYVSTRPHVRKDDGADCKLA
jgi:hypothetical protein